MSLKILNRIAPLSLLLTLSFSGCALDDLLNGSEPPQNNEVDPKLVKSYSGAVRLYNASIRNTMEAVSSASEMIAVFTDEQTTGEAISARTPLNVEDGVDAGYTYAYLQRMRVVTSQAVEALRKYGTEDSKGMIGNAYALQAYSIVLMADAFCSGVPLTVVPFEGDLKYTAGIPTNELYERAVALFDSAYEYGKDSVPVATLAQVGKGRALLALGRYNEAAAAVQNVDDAARYEIVYTPPSATGFAFWTQPTNKDIRVTSKDGTNGIEWTADSAKNQDPRVPLSKIDDYLYANPIRQQKYTVANIRFPAATGIEARMIEAEAQLQPVSSPSGPWLQTINDARATVSLPPLADPGNALARVDLLFKERAFWFYLNATRLGDMRRLVRDYGRSVLQVYPVGANAMPSVYYPVYGNEYVFDIPKAERDNNPLFKGCTNRRP